MLTGYKNLAVTDEQLTELYSDTTRNIFDCLINEYAVLRNTDGEVIDKLRWNGGKYANVSWKSSGSRYSDKIKPRNPEQELAFDMVQNRTMTVKILTGAAGSGKSCIMVSNALAMLDDNRFDKIVFVRNNYEVANSKPIGHLPGSAIDKLMEWAMPFADHSGGVSGVEYLISQGRLELLHLGFARGRDLRNCILMVGEAENLSVEHLQLLLSRVGEGSELWLDGDVKQVDARIFEQSSGLTRCIERLSGNPLFGHIKLDKIERSKTAALAELLD